MPDPAWSTIFMVLILAVNLVGVRYNRADCMTKGIEDDICSRAPYFLI